jgi:hypothetical protein
MNQNFNIKFLNQKKDNIILRIQFLSYILNNHQLALDRIKEAEDFVKFENKKVLNNPINSPELIAYLYVHYPAFTQNGVYFGYDDFLNFISRKAEIVIENDANRKMILDNYDFALKSWDDARTNILNSKKFLIEYVQLLNKQLEAINKKINDALYNEDETIDQGILKDQKKKNNSFDKIATMYLNACEKLNLDSPNPYQLSEVIEDGPSKNNWYRKLKDPAVLFNIKTKVDKKVKNSKLKKTDLHFWVNVRDGVELLMQKAADKLSKNKEISLDYKLEYYESKFDTMSQPTKNKHTNWDD